MKSIVVGVLAFHGDVIEHMEATNTAANKLRIDIKVIPARTKDEVLQSIALIIPGGESTTLHMLCEREGMFSLIKNVPFIFGTCAGAILLAKNVLHKTPEKETLACEERKGKSYYLAACFHPELTTSKFHEYFLKQVLKK